MRYSLFNIFIISTTLAVVVLCSIFYNFIYMNDVSMQEKTECNHLNKSRVWLISYAGGKKAHYANQFALIHSAINRCVDNIKSYNQSTLDPSFKKNNSNILKLARGDGYWLWKPYIILDTLKQIPEGDIIIYVDSGARIIENMDVFINNLGDKDILAFENDHTNRKYIKRSLLKIMNMDREEIRNSTQLMASYIAFRNNEFTRSFVRQWLELCMNEEALTDTPSDNEYPDFYDHRHDQSIFSLLALKYPKHFKILVNKEAAKYFYHHRRREMVKNFKLLPQYYPVKKPSFFSEFFTLLLK